MAPRIRKRPGRDKTARGAEQKALDARSIAHSCSEREQRAAVSVFVAGLPDFRRGRIVTSSSEPDAWRWKHPAIERRLEAGRRLREAQA